MGRIESFRELTVWQKSHQLFFGHCSGDLGYITKTVVAERAEICNEILKMLNALIGSLQRKIS